MKKLQEILNTEKDVKTKSTEILKEGIQTFKNKEGHFTGFSKTYQPSDENGASRPPESKHIVDTVPSKVKYVTKTLKDLIDLTLTKEATNTQTKADLVLPDGTVLIKGLPSTGFLFLEHAVNNLREFILHAPTLSPDEKWTADPHRDDIFESEVAKTIATVKDQVPLVLYPHSDKFPAQTQLITKDVRVGEWSIKKFSGAIPSKVKADWLNKIDVLGIAVKEGKARANDINATEVKAGDALLDFIFNK